MTSDQDFDAYEPPDNQRRGDGYISSDNLSFVRPADEGTHHLRAEIAQLEQRVARAEAGIAALARHLAQRDGLDVDAVQRLMDGADSAV